MYGGGKDIKEVTISEDSFDKSVFATSPIVDLETCHSASKPKNGSKDSLAEELNRKLGGVTYGYDGRVDYAPAAKGGMPTKGSSIDKNHAVADLNKFHDDDTFNISKIF